MSHACHHRDRRPQAHLQTPRAEDVLRLRRNAGSWTEQTFRENTSDFDEIRLRQRIAVDMDQRTTAQMIGQDVAMPVALAPVG
jgi:isopentenyl diphosphate isomerase/L-lactate dehydrogenase-like FMN-dependent dehydrogenase